MTYYMKGVRDLNLFTPKLVEMFLQLAAPVNLMRLPPKYSMTGNKFAQEMRFDANLRPQVLVIHEVDLLEKVSDERHD